MSTANLFSWAAQALIIGSIGAMLPMMLRMRHPRSHLLYCQVVLAACLFLPLLQPWRRPAASEEVVGALQVRVANAAVVRSGGAAMRIPWQSVVLWILAAGAVAKLCWLT